MTSEEPVFVYMGVMSDTYDSSTILFVADTLDVAKAALEKARDGLLRYNREASWSVVDENRMTYGPEGYELLRAPLCKDVSRR